MTSLIDIPKIRPLRKRADFLRLRAPEKLGGRFYKGRSFLMQAAPLFPDDPDIILGLTVTKKLGNAVTRNRIKRRLRAAAQQILPRSANTGYAYVLIAKSAAAHIPFTQLLDDLKAALVIPGAAAHKAVKPLSPGHSA